MTAQCRERLIYNGEEYYLATEPLASYLIKHYIRFIAPHTACWRGYIGSWLIEDNKLYLVDLKANISEGNKKFGADKEVGLDFLFPGQTKVFANWYSEVIRIPHGKMMKYVHQGYASLYEKELFLRFESGILVSYREEDNTHFYANKKRMEERNMSDLCEAIFGVKLQKKGNWLHNLFRHLHKLYRR
ncbi:hypothetical protein [Bacteroides bouchesdurhonensis]|jgi:hypothetical protein|uniref:hypothetical protein n=1 Tax=Bacteroides bouchesdurhonensis TaxID=1841855 RepID=UPI00097F798A|nr:hypothetical protein [Bacteroides bouchesdurhonensis]